MRWNGNGCSNSTSAGTPSGKFLDPAANPVASPETIDEFFDERASQIYSWMDRLEDGQVGRACTNLLPHESRITAPFARPCRTRCAWNPAILSTAQDTKSRIAGAQPMAVLHVRVPDADFRSLQTTQPARCVPRSSLACRRLGPTWAVLSNNPGLRAAVRALWLPFDRSGVGPSRHLRCQRSGGPGHSGRLCADLQRKAMCSHTAPMAGKADSATGQLRFTALRSSRCAPSTTEVTPVWKQGPQKRRCGSPSNRAEPSARSASQA